MNAGVSPEASTDPELGDSGANRDLEETHRSGKRGRARKDNKRVERRLNRWRLQKGKIKS